MTMSGPDESRIRNVPIRVIFTDSGARHFMKRNQRLSRVRLSDDREEYGINLVDFSPRTLQKMLGLDYLSKIEHSVTDIVAQRGALMDFTKLIIYGMLYRQFDTEIFTRLMESDLVRGWNRRNARNPIDFQTSVNTRYLQHVLESHSSTVQAVHEDILEPVFEHIDARSTLIEEDRRLHGFIAERFVQSLGPLSQFLLMTHRGSPAYWEIVSEIQKGTRDYVEKTPVAEYLALMLLEVLTSLKHDAGLHRENVDEAVSLLWKIRSTVRAPGDRARLHVIVSDRGSRFEEVKDTINDRAKLAVKKKSLNDFYMKDPDAAESNSLGLYYLSFVHDACTKVGIRFESFVHSIPKEDQTLVNLVLTF